MLETLGKWIKSAGIFIDKHRPEILTGVGIGGMIGTVVLAVRSTPKALVLLEEKRRAENVEKLSAAQTVKTAWKCYIPAAVTGALSTTCLIGGSALSYRRTAALATACTISENALKTYQQKNPVREGEVTATGYGDTLFYDTMSGRYFRSDIDAIKRAVNELNRRMIGDMYVSLNDFYDEVGLTHNDVGDILGWNVNRGFIEVHFSAQIAEDEKTPCIVLNHDVPAVYNYQYC